MLVSWVVFITLSNLVTIFQRLQKKKMTTRSQHEPFHVAEAEICFSVS